MSPRHWLLLILLLIGLRAWAQHPWIAADLPLQRLTGQLESADFIHRAGQLRTADGQLISFSLPPYATVTHHGAEADLRDIPLGTVLTLSAPPTGEASLRPITLEGAPAPDPQATETQRATFAASIRRRGIPGYIEKTQGNEITIHLLSGDPATFAKNFPDGFALNRTFALCVANDELRTWNPPVDKESPVLLSIEKIDHPTFGSSGVRLVCTAKYMLEGFRRGHYVRVFGSGWPLKDQPYGESLMGYGYARLQTEELMENPAREYPEQFPFRTDFGNRHLPWYRPQGDTPLPRFSEHVVHGELVQLDAASRTGELREEPTGRAVKFTLLPKAELKYLNTAAKADDLPRGQRYRFHLHPDDSGTLTLASLVCDDFSYMAANLLTWRVTAVRLEPGEIEVARRIPEVKNYNGDMEQPEDLGRALLRVGPETRVWKGPQQVTLQDLALGDLLLANFTADFPNRPAQCTDIWIGVDTHQSATAQQSQKFSSHLPK